MLNTSNLQSKNQEIPACFVILICYCSYNSFDSPAMLSEAERFARYFFSLPKQVPSQTLFCMPVINSHLCYECFLCTMLRHMTGIHVMLRHLLREIQKLSECKSFLPRTASSDCSSLWKTVTSKKESQSLQISTDFF